MNNFRLLFWGLLLMLHGGVVQGQMLPMHHLIDAETRASDARLDTNVNFDADRMCLGEVLEKVSVQTGVSVSIPAEDSNSGIPITCHLKNTPLSSVMNAIWSLVSLPYTYSGERMTGNLKPAQMCKPSVRQCSSQIKPI